MTESQDEFGGTVTLSRKRRNFPPVYYSLSFRFFCHSHIMWQENEICEHTLYTHIYI